MAVDHSGPPASNAIQDDPRIHCALSAIRDGNRNDIRGAHLALKRVLLNTIDEHHAAGGMTPAMKADRVEATTEFVSASCEKALTMSRHERRRTYRSLADVFREGARALKLKLIRRVAWGHLRPGAKPLVRASHHSHRPRCWAAHRGRAACGGDASGGDDAGTGDGPAPDSRQDPAWSSVTGQLIAPQISRLRCIVTHLGDCPLAWEIATAAADLELEGHRVGVLR